ncbi:hypothetical protein HPB51_024040 [Rhipicephalus microplus]|uniref:RING-type domain-containing protein n=1 Tax=Rhipicephalus microplus TaxID=6941 RepID=A0A9J6EDF4_RHIMP|nr:hypothetical protein HPB51_024040 [Rhipicephalus microplus]
MDAARLHARYTVSGFSSEYDWRPIVFEEPVDARKICASCRVLSRSTALLGCAHALCEPCYVTSLENGQRCPMDEASYVEASVDSTQSPATAVTQKFRGPACVTTETLVLPNTDVKLPVSKERRSHRSVQRTEPGRRLGEASDTFPRRSRGFQYNLETKLNSLVEHVHSRETSGVSKSELINTAVSLLRSVGLLSLSATWRPRGLAVLVSRVHYFTRQAPEYAEEVYSAPSNVCGYSLRLGVRCEHKLVSPTKSVGDNGKNKQDLVLRFKVQLCPAAANSALQWPFRKSLTFSVMHPQDSTKEVRFFLNTSMMSSEPAFPDAHLC